MGAGAQGIGALLLGAVAGFGAGYVVFGGSGAPALLTPGPAATAGAGVSTDPAAASATAPATAATAPDSSPTGLVAPPAATATLATSASPIAVGDGVVTGSVRTPDGAPCPGVLLRATPTEEIPDRAEAVGEAAPPDESPEIAGQRRAAELAAQVAARRETRTGLDGAFRLEGLAAITYTVRAWTQGFDVRHGTVSSPRVRPGDRLELVATPVGLVRIGVVGPDGQPPAEARIDLLGAGGRLLATRPWTPDRPLLRLAPGAHRLRARTVRGSAGAVSALRSDEVMVQVGSAPTAPVSLVLRPTPGITGRVVVPDGSVADSLLVYCLRVSERAVPDPGDLARKGERAWAYDPERRFTFPELAPGTWCIGASRDREGAVAVQALVEVADTLVEHDLVLPPLDPNDGLVVQVLDAGGQPIPVVTFGQNVERDGGTVSGAATVTRRADGSWWIARQRASSGKTVKLTLRITAEGHGEAVRRVPEPLSGPLVVRFRPVATLVLTLDGWRGSRLEGRLGTTLEPAEVSDEGAADHSSHWQRAMAAFQGLAGGLDASGRKVLGPVQSGESVLTLWIREGGSELHQILAAVRRPITLVPGENRLTVPVPTLHTVTALAPGMAEGTDVSLQSTLVGGYGSRQGTFDAQGRAIFEGVPAGTYSFSAWGAGDSRSARCTVPDQLEVTLVKEKVDALYVSISDEAGPLAKAGLKEGDYLIGVDGVAFENESQMSFQMAAAKGKPSVTFRVQRDDRELDVTLNPAILFTGNPGGEVFPSGR